MRVLEAPLLPCALSPSRGLIRMCVIRQRVVTIDECNILRVRSKQLVHHLIEPFAEGALVVTELDDDHGGAGWSDPASPVAIDLPAANCLITTGH